MEENLLCDPGPVRDNDASIVHNGGVLIDMRAVIVCTPRACMLSFRMYSLHGEEGQQAAPCQDDEVLQPGTWM